MKPGEQTVDGAISRVLGAESEALAGIAAARRESAQRIDRAHEQARAMHDVGEHRIVALRRAVERHIAQREAQVDEAIAALRADPPEPRNEAPLVTQAASRLAAELTGGSP